MLSVSQCIKFKPANFHLRSQFVYFSKGSFGAKGNNHTPIVLGY